MVEFCKNGTDTKAFSKKDISKKNSTALFYKNQCWLCTALDKGFEANDKKHDEVRVGAGTKGISKSKAGAEGISKPGAGAEGISKPGAGAEGISKARGRGR